MMVACRQTPFRWSGRSRKVIATGWRRRWCWSGRRRPWRGSGSSSKLPGYRATWPRWVVGASGWSWSTSGTAYEVVAIGTTEPRRGIGRALMGRCVAEARARGCRRVWLVTTNNNLAAIGFYQRLGMDLCALHRHAVHVSRKLKPTIPVRDATRVRIDHELEFELLLET